MMFCHVIRLHVGLSWGPVDIELFLLCAVAHPVETHVDGFGAFVLDLAVGEPGGSGVVDLHGGGRLGVAKFLEGDAYVACFTGGHEGSAYLCFHSGAHDGGDDLGKDVDWAIGSWFFCWFLVRVVTFVAEKEPSTYSAAGFRFRKV